jgi:hypothetical protein
MAGPLSPSSAHAAKYVDAAEFRADVVPPNGKVALITGVTGKSVPDRIKMYTHSAATPSPPSRTAPPPQKAHMQGGTASIHPRLL